VRARRHCIRGLPALLRVFIIYVGSFRIGDRLFMGTAASVAQGRFPGPVAPQDFGGARASVAAFTAQGVVVHVWVASTTWAEEEVNPQAAPTVEWTEWPYRSPIPLLTGWRFEVVGLTTSLVPDQSWTSQSSSIVPQPWSPT